MEKLGEWSKKIECSECGVPLKITEADLRVELVGNYGQSRNLLTQIPQYFINCVNCTSKTVLEKLKLPSIIESKILKKNKIDLEKIVRYCP